MSQESNAIFKEKVLPQISSLLSSSSSSSSSQPFYLGFTALIEAIDVYGPGAGGTARWSRA